MSQNKEQSPSLVMFHIGGGDEDVGPADHLLNLKTIPIELYIFEIIDESDYTEVKRFQKYPNVKAKIVPFGIGEFEGEVVELHVNEHQLSSSLLEPSQLTLKNNPAYPGIKNWEENTKLNYKIKTTLNSIDNLVSKGIVPPPNFISLDIQGYELKALRGAKNALENSVLGIVLESEFAEIYSNQDLFDSQSIYLRSKAFRLVDLFQPQKWFIGPVIGEGFLTVVESLHLKHVIKSNHANDNHLEGAINHSEIEPGNLFKLAIISFAFKRFSYFFYLMEILENSHLNYFENMRIDQNAHGFIDLYKKIKLIWNENNSDHLHLQKNFHKVFKSELRELSKTKVRGNTPLSSLIFQIKTYLFSEFPFLLLLKKLKLK